MVSLVHVVGHDISQACDNQLVGSLYDEQFSLLLLGHFYLVALPTKMDLKKSQPAAEGIQEDEDFVTSCVTRPGNSIHCFHPHSHGQTSVI